MTTTNLIKIVRYALFAALLTITGCDQSGNHTRTKQETTIQGPVRVHYSIQDTEKATFVSHGDFESIQITDKLVILQGLEDQGGRLIPINRLKTFSWEDIQIETKKHTEEATIRQFHQTH